MDEMPSLEPAIEKALSHDYPERGAHELDSFIREGYRSHITDRLLTLLEVETNFDRKVNLVGLTWALHASGGGEFEKNLPVRPKAFVSHPDEAISAIQFRRFVDIAAHEKDPELFGEYASTMHAIGRFDLLDDNHRKLVRSFCQRCLDHGFDDAKQRANYILRQLERIGPPESTR